MLQRVFSQEKLDRLWILDTGAPQHRTSSSGYGSMLLQSCYAKLPKKLFSKPLACETSVTTAREALDEGEVRLSSKRL
jgi:hypothetical protein